MGERLARLLRHLPFGAGRSAREDVARDELAELRRLCDRQGAMLQDKLGEAKLLDLRGGASAGGGLDIRLEGGPIGYIAEYLFQFMRAGSDTGKPANFMETECIPRFAVQHGASGERYVLTVQRIGGLSPGQKERAANARVKALEEALEPFAKHGVPEDHPEDGDLLHDLMRDRIVDWFGPSDFERARRAYAGEIAHG